MTDTVNCRKCGTGNLVGARFYSKCGSELVDLCANCQNPLPEGAEFCPTCGHKVESDGEPETVSAEDRVRRYIPAALLEKLEAASKAGGKLH